MNIRVTELAARSNKYYPYTHRLEFSTDLYKEERIRNWLNDTNTDCRIMPYHQVSPWTKTIAVYMNPKDATAFMLQWQ